MHAKMPTPRFSIPPPRALPSTFRTALTSPRILSNSTTRRIPPRPPPLQPNPLPPSPLRRNLRQLNRNHKLGFSLCLLPGRLVRSGSSFLFVFSSPATLILLLPCLGHILSFRSVTGRTMRWAQAHFFVGP